MRSRVVIYLVVAVIAAAALAVGIVAVAGAGQTNPLPAISAPDLLVKMQQQSDQTKNISGDVSWQNNLLGDLSSITGGSSFGGTSAKLPLAASGSGRVWVGEGGVRMESQASGGDQVVVANATAHDLWSYDYAAGTATHVVVTGASSDTAQPTPTPSVATPAAVTAFLERLASVAKVEVTGQTTIAGRDTYLVTMTPSATDTALGSVQAAIDGQTYVPLELQVFARGDTSPVLQFGFTSVSYDAIPASTFAFTPPAGTTVTTKTIDLSQAANDSTTTPQKDQMRKMMQQMLLTVPEAQKLVDYPLASAQGYTARPFQWASVIDKGMPLTALGNPVFDLAKMGLNGGQLPAGDSTSGATQMGPTSVLLYGNGFGTIALAQTKTTAALDKQLKQLPAIVDSTSVNGTTVRSLTTPLGGAFIWQQGDTTLIAGGMVPKADLQAFVASVH